MITFKQIFGIDEPQECYITALKELLTLELKDIYWVEKAIEACLPLLANAATTDMLKLTLESHQEHTSRHIQKLEKVFSIIDEKAEAVKSEAMNGLIEEATHLIHDTEGGTFLRDVALISIIQKIKHYEIASYSNLRSHSSLLGYLSAAELLRQTLEEEKFIDELLAQIAEEKIYEFASAES